MATIANLVVQISAKSSGLRRELANARKSAVKFAGSIGKTFAKIGLAATATFAVATGAILAMINSTANEIDVLAKSASSLGLTVAELQALQFAANLAGLSNQQLTGIITRLQKSISDANNGLSTSIRAFDAIGVSIDKLQKLTPAEQFELVAKKLGDVEDQTKAAGAAMDIFGRQGAKALNLFRGGIDGATKEFKSFQISLTQGQAKAVETFNDAQTRFAAIWTGFKQQVTANVAPAFTAIILHIRNTILEMGGVRVIALRAADSLISFAVAAVRSLTNLPKLFAFISTAGIRLDGIIRQIAIQFAKLKVVALDTANFIGFALGGDFGAVLTEQVLKAEQDLALLQKQAMESGEQIREMMEAAEATGAIENINNLVKTLEEARGDIQTTLGKTIEAQAARGGAPTGFGTEDTKSRRTVTLADVQRLTRLGGAAVPQVNIRVDAKTRELFNFIVENPQFTDRINNRVDSRTENARRRITR